MKASILVVLLLSSLGLNTAYAAKGNSTPSELKAAMHEDLNCTSDDECERKAARKVVSLEKQLVKLQESYVKAEAKLQAKAQKIERTKALIEQFKGE